MFAVVAVAVTPPATGMAPDDFAISLFAVVMMPSRDFVPLASPALFAVAMMQSAVTIDFIAASAWRMASARC